MKQCACGSYAINPASHGRDGTRLDLCDVCFYRDRLAAAEAERDALMEQAIEAHNECVAAMLERDRVQKLPSDIAKVVGCEPTWDGATRAIAALVRERDALRAEVAALRAALEEQATHQRERCPGIILERLACGKCPCTGCLAHPARQRALGLAP